jgi:hypothetical protein
MNGDLPFLNILFRGGFFQLAAELVPHQDVTLLAKPASPRDLKYFI